MRYSTVPAINDAALIAHNRELIASLPEAKPAYRTWNPDRLAYDVNEACLDLYHEMFVTTN